MSNYFDKWPDLCFVRRSDGRRVLATEVLKQVDYLLLYFGPEWHPASRRFTPRLKAFYERHHTAKRFEVLYISRGSTEEEVRRDFLGEDSHGSAPPPLPPSLPGVQHGEREAGAEGSPSMENPSTTRGDAPHGETSRVSRHGDYYALPVADMEEVAVPLLYHFRVFSYPAVLVLDNRPEAIAEQRAKVGSTFALVPDGFSPITRPTPAEGAGGRVMGANGATQKEQPLTRIEYDSKGHRKYTPRIESKSRVPKLVSIAGYFMIEEGDPDGEQFPWASLGGPSAAQRRTFLSIVVAALAFVCCVLIRFVIPALLEGDRLKKSRRRALTAAKGARASL